MSSTPSNPGQNPPPTPGPAPAPGQHPNPGPGPFVQQLLQCFQARGVRGQCPMCGKNSWIANEAPTVVPVVDYNLQPVRNAASPQAPYFTTPLGMLICRQCGWTGFFSLHVLGMLQSRPAAQPPQGPVHPAAGEATSPSTNGPSPTT